MSSAENGKAAPADGPAVDALPFDAKVDAQPFEGSNELGQAEKPFTETCLFRALAYGTLSGLAVELIARVQDKGSHTGRRRRYKAIYSYGHYYVH